MLKNKKKLRRLERTTPGYAARTAQTLVLAGMLLAPAMAGVAQAAANWGALNDVIFTTSENVATAEAKKLTIKSGTLTNTNSTGHIFVSGDTVLNDGATLSLGGKAAGPGFGLIGVDKASEAAGTFNGEFTMKGGTLNVGTAASDDTANGGFGNNGSQLQMNEVDINGGVVNIQGRVGDTNTWTSGSMIVGGLNAGGAESYLTVSGGTINMGDYAQLVVGKKENESIVSMNISGGTIKMNGSTGKEAIIRASAGNTIPSDTAVGSKNYAKLNISGGLIAVGAGKHGVILSRETNMRAGELNVAGTLTVAGAAAGTGNIQAGIGSADKKWGAFNLTGGIVNVTGAGKLDFQAGDVTLKVAGGTLNTTNLVMEGATVAGPATLPTTGTFLHTGSTISSGHVNVGGNLYAGSSHALSVTGTGVLTINKASIATTGGTVGSGGITLGTGGAGGALVVKGFEGVTVDSTVLGAYGYSGTTFTAAANSTLNLTKYDGNNVILQGAKFSGTVSKDITGTTVASAPEQLNVKKQGDAAAAITTNGAITAPSLMAEGGTLSNGGKLILDGAVANAGVSKTTALTSFESKGTAITTVSSGADLNMGTYTHTAGATTVANGGSLSAQKTIITTGTLDVLHAKADLGTLTMGNGASIFVDPAYVTIDGVDGTLGGLLISGLGGVINVGTRDRAWIDQAISRSGAAPDASVLAMKSGIDLGATGLIVVAKSVTKTATGYKVGGIDVGRAQQAALAFGDNSLLVVDAKAFSGTQAAFTVSGSDNTLKTLNTESTPHTPAKLHIYGGQSGATVKIVSGATGIKDTLEGNVGWTKDQISFSSGLVGLDSIITTGGSIYDVKLKGVAAGSVFPKLSSSMAGLVDGMFAQAGVDVDHGNVGVRFVSRAVDSRFIGAGNAEKAAATIEGAAQMGAVAGVQISTMGAANAASGAALTRTSFAQPLMDMTKAVAVHQDADGALSLDTGLSAGNGMKNGLGVWIMPLYQSNKTWGQKAENFKTGMSSDLGGIALGADYTIDDMFRFGAAFNVGGGYAQSDGDFNKTENRFNFWGINLYGGWAMNNFGLSADVGYSSNYNKVEQDVPAGMAMGNLKSDITSSAWTAGLKGEYKIETSMLDIIPHVGVRYMGLTTDKYDVKSGGTVFKVDKDFQSIWTFPIGVAFSKTIASDSGPSAWTFKPQVDLSVIPAAGDLKAKSKSRIPGVGSTAEMKMQVVDAVTFDGGVGFEVGKDNVSFGLNYNVQASEHRTGHGVFGTLRYEF